MKHKAVILAWLEGKQIQVKSTDGYWFTFNEYSFISPMTHPDREWRIKPRKQDGRYQTARK